MCKLVIMSLTTLPADYYDLSFLHKINYSDDDDDNNTFNNSNNNNECVVNKDQQSNVISARKNHKKKKSDDDSDDEDFEDNCTNNYIILNTNCKSNNNNNNDINDRVCNNINQLLFNNTEIIDNSRSTSGDDDIQWSHLIIMPVAIEKDNEDEDDCCCCPLQLNNIFHNDTELFCAIQLHLFEQWCKKMNRTLPHSILSCLFYRCFYIVIVSQDYYYNDQQISSPSTISSISDDKYVLAKIIPYYLASIMHLSPSWICSCRDIITVLRGRITLHEVIYSSLHIPMDHHHHHHDCVGNTNTTTNSTTTNTIPSTVLHNHHLSYLEVVFNTILILMQRYQKNISFISYYRHPQQPSQPQQQLSAHDSTVAISQLCDLFTLLCILFCDHSIQSHFYTIISYTIQLLLDILLEIQLNDQLYYQQQHLSGQQLQSLSNGHSTIDSDRVSTSNTGVSEGNIIIPLQLKRSIVKLSKLSGK